MSGATNNDNNTLFFYFVLLLLLAWYNNDVGNKFLKEGTLTSATLYFSSRVRLNHTSPLYRHRYCTYTYYCHQDPCHGRILFFIFYILYFIFLIFYFLFCQVPPRCWPWEGTGSH
jgi:hypothetical protein